ncbi:MAG: hypothetical protein NC928_04640 [Candidatus Omnitrophica bacterium]|nr:hypothetical protein [Candidatus Omnitrophota bacterium]
MRLNLWFLVTKHCKVGRAVVLSWLLFVYLIFFISVLPLSAQETGAKKTEPIIVNGDRVEYSTDNKEVIATGNAEVIYKGMKLTCQRLIVNTETKDAEAQGNARLEDERAVIEAEKLTYNFNTKTGIIIDSNFRANPYFGRAEKISRVSDREFIAHRGYMSTCSYDNPHYRIKFRRINFFPQDKVQTRDATFYLGHIPLVYLPWYNHSLRDPLVHVQLMPGKNSAWGGYLLTAFRYNLTDNIKGRIYFDLRQKLGIAEGFGLNYTTEELGKGDFKYYYTQERSRKFAEGLPAEFQRYLIRWRHKWDIDEKTQAIAEYYKIVDSKYILYGGDTLLKEYFYREYEKDTQPLSYISLHRALSYSSLDLLFQKRINRWYSQSEYLPQIKYSLPNIKMFETPFYFENISSYTNYNEKSAVPSASWNDVSYNKFSTLNKFSLPTKIAFINFNPYVLAQPTYYDRYTYGSTLELNFSGGSDLSTKFYRLFNVKTNFLGLDINGLRHIITPSIAYSYKKNSTTPIGALRIGGGFLTASGSSAELTLSNKLQTKRKGSRVDIADFRITSTYNIKPKSGDKKGSNFSDFLFDLELRPYSWLRLDADATFKHSGDRSQSDYKKFTTANYDINFDLGKERTIGLGQRYQRNGGNEITLDIGWRLNPKWKLRFYERYNHGHSPSLKRGLREQEYSLLRDLHCWTLDFTYNIKKAEGHTIWIIFRLKAFPELEFEFNQGYHAPKSGVQANQ